jgi:hypothetical protein
MTPEEKTIKDAVHMHRIVAELHAQLEKFRWISVKDSLPNCEKVLAVCLSEKGVAYNLKATGWFMDTVYACWMRDSEFIIESHGPILPATHWMPIPDLPKE